MEWLDEMNGLRKEEGMECWVPLFQIFLHSPTPEGDASLWLHRHQQSPSDFLSLLDSPAAASLLWIQTLPPTIQSRILSFLAADHYRFCPRRLHSLASHILLPTATPSSQDHSVFWVRCAARQLLDTIPLSLRDHQFQERSTKEDEDFDALPDWLQAHASATGPLLSFLPIPAVTILTGLPPKPPVIQEVPEPMEQDTISPPLPQPLHPQDYSRAFALRTELLSSNTTSQALHLSTEIKQLCLGSGTANQLKLLSLIEPWQSDDETSSVLLSHLSSNKGSSSNIWPAHVLCSIALPKLLVLQGVASRSLLSATVSFCKLHQREAVEALVFPLVIRKSGITVHLCDVLVRIIKECLHPAHVSAFCQKLLCYEGGNRNLTCQPCHQELIANEVEWTEPLFTLFQHILNNDVVLTPDSVDRLVNVVVEMASKFSKSLKFGNFLLCFVSKSQRASSHHRIALVRAAEKTESFVTKSILAKLGDP